MDFTSSDPRSIGMELEFQLLDAESLDLLVPEPGAIYVMDRAYVDFGRLHILHLAGAFFVTRTKSNMDFHRVYSAQTDRSTGIICDQTIALDGFYTKQTTPHICAVFASRIQRPARRWSFSPTR